MNIVAEMIFKGHSRSSAMFFFVRSYGLFIRDGRIGYTYFQRKIAEMTFKVDQGHWRCQHSSVDIYYNFLLVVCSSHVSLLDLVSCLSRQRLRSASRHQLLVPRYRLSSLGRRSFAVAGPMTWNSLSANLRDPTCSDESFRRSLKTFLFAKY